MKFILSLTIILLLLPLAIAQEEVTFSEEEVKTWHKDWQQIKSKAGSNLQGVNQDWKSASSEDRQNTINDLINSDNTISTKGFGSDQLQLDEDGKLTNGKAIFDPEKLPPGTTSVEYSESDNGFVYKFDSKFVKIRNGQLNQDLSITGTGWPSDGLKWNKEGAFNQDSTGVLLEGDAEIDVGRMHVSKLIKDKPSRVSFREGDSGREYVKGNNLKVEIKDLAVIRIPEKTTEVFIGDKQPSLPNQHIKISSDGSIIDANADDVQIDLLRELKTLNANGDNIVIKNKDLIIRVKDDEDGKSQVYINKPAEANEVTINNKRNKEGDVTTSEGLDEEVKETEREIEETNNFIKEAEEEKKRILEEQKRQLEERKRQQQETDKTESDSGRIKYVHVGDPSGLTASERGFRTTNTKYNVQDFNNIPPNLDKKQFEIELSKRSKKIEVTALLRVTGLSKLGHSEFLNRQDIIKDFKTNSEFFETYRGGGYTSSNTRNIITLFSRPGSLLNEFPVGSKIVTETNEGRGNPTITFYNPNGGKIRSISIDNQAQANSLKKYINYRIAQTTNPKTNVRTKSSLDTFYTQYQKR